MKRLSCLMPLFLLALAFTGGCDKTSRNALLGLGEECTSAGICSSGFCADGVCSECEEDADCPGSGTCVDDGAGVGYHVCEGGLGMLGDACTTGAECDSGFCNGDLCSECAADGDCAGAATCEDDTAGVGYFVCQAGSGVLGDDCTTGADCASGFCNGDLCSECEADGDCPGAATCEDDTAGLGYFVCQAGSGALGDDCTTGADCASGFCNGDLCSECEGDGDCPGAATCEDDMAGVGYFVCQSGLSSLGEDCTSGDECESGLCNSDVCSECEGDGDCPGAATCEDDTAGVGYFVCQAGSGLLGDDCTSGADCASGFCNGDVCSECEGDGDCADGQTCVDDSAGLGYFICEGQPGALGDVCAQGSDCASGFCNSNVCSECAGDGDCASGEACVDDLAGAGYFVCQTTTGGLGDACVEDTDCDSGYCNNDVCSLCAMNGDCLVQQECAYDNQLGYSLCQGTGDLGDSCDQGEQCVSGFCNNSVCSECEGDADCTGGGLCLDDTQGVGYYVCSGGLGDDCTTGDDCVSGFCNNNRCSECEQNSDCGVQQECDFWGGVGYARCRGTGDLGDSCDTDEQCISTFCNNNVCSQCNQDSDCGDDGACLDATDDPGYWVCAGGLGDPCSSSTTCISSFCFNPPGPGVSVCSECEVDDDCQVQQACEFSGQEGYASCAGTGDLGDPCDSADQCADGFCNSNVCSACESDADCDGGSCALDPGGADFYTCLGALGDDCGNGDECLSGFCYNVFMAQDVCSECEENNDCGQDETCEYADGLGYANCRGTAELGEACTDGVDCQSGFCNGDVCSECGQDSDCGEGGVCLDDTAGVGYHVCLGALGDMCQEAAECGTGFCYEVFQGVSFCSECMVDDDCLDGQVCDFQMGDIYATCEGSGALGDACTADAGCASGMCNDSICSSCLSDSDCDGEGACMDDTADSGYYLCAGGLGDDCADDADCGSGFCFNPPGPGSWVCGECTDDGDCPNGTCTMDWQLGYGTCS